MKFDKTTTDCHLHLYHWFDENGKDYFTHIDEYQKRFGLENLNICALPFHYADVSANIMAALYKLHNKTAYAYGGLMYSELPVKLPVPEGLDPLTQYREMMEMGLDGIKLIETKPDDSKMLGLSICDDFYDNFFAEAEKNNTHFVWHVADPKEFWDANKIPKHFIERGWFYGDGTYPTYEQIYEDVFNVLEKYPKLNVTFAHFFFLSNEPEQLEEIFNKYENVSIDITPGSEMFKSFYEKYDYYKDFFEKYSDRILFGTDVSFPQADMEYLNIVASETYRSITTSENVKVHMVESKGLDLSAEACSKILHTNFKKYCHNKPAAINKSALKKYIEKYSCYIEDEVAKDMICKFAQNNL